MKSKFLDRISRIGIGEERDFFLENLSSLLASGIPILSAIDAVNAEMRSRRLKQITAALSADIDAGVSLSEALEHTGLFSPHVASLIRTGERSGRLVENLKVIATEQKKERFLRSKLRSAAMYPVFVLGLSVVIGVGISWFILPKLATVFAQMDIKLPLITRALIGIGTFLGQYGAYAVPGVILLALLLLYLIFSFSKTKLVGEFIVFNAPGVKRLMKESEVARFGFLLGSLLTAGLSPVEALQSLSRATPAKRYQDLYSAFSEWISEGYSFQRCIAEYKNVRKLIPVPVQQLVIAAEQAGTLSETLKKIGDEYEAKTDASAKDLAIILEPILLVIVWLGVVAVALAVVLPIYSLIGGFQSPV